MGRKHDEENSLQRLAPAALPERETYEARSDGCDL